MNLRTIAATIFGLATIIAIMAIEPQELINKQHNRNLKEDTRQTLRKELDKLALTEDDYIEVAKELGVEVAAIKAVVEVEAGRAHEGFSAPGKPLLNFDITMFRQFARKNGINLAKYTGTHSEVFNRPNVKKYGSQQAGQFRRFELARTIDEKTAIQGGFWGMFQIGGFNWKLCGTDSPQHFLELMSRSERDQLDMFAKFITSTGLVKYLKAKNWAQFARIYNGPSYAARGYHTKLANAYARHRSRTAAATTSSAEQQDEATEHNEEGEAQ